MGLLIMVYNSDRFMKICDVPICAQSVGFTASFGTFLDHFYHHAELRSYLIEKEPIKANLPADEYCLLAAAAHKLAKDYELFVPPWVMDKKFVMPYPVYGFDTKNKEFQDALRATTPAEFSAKNLFFGSKILSRA